VPVEVVPHFSRVAGRDAGARLRTRQRRGIPPDACLIGAFGYIAPTKQCDLLLEALEAPELAGRRLHLVLVGEIAAGPYGARMRELIRRSSHRDRITVTGYASEDDYQHWLGACDIYVSLRTLWRGESSGGLHRALGTGLACVVTDGGSFAELPRDVVFHVAPDSAPAVAGALAALLDDGSLRARYGERAERFARESLAPERVAEAYARATARIAAAARAGSVDGLAEGLALVGADWNVPRETLANAARIAAAALQQ
jgi:glycosyltransferase involved in cell wall biosynthesis